MSRRAKRPKGSIRCRDEHGEANRCALLITLAERQNWRCCYCGRRLTILPARPDTATYEHVIPYAVDRSWREENLVAACLECNNGRHKKPGSMSPDGMTPSEVRALQTLLNRTLPNPAGQGVPAEQRHAWAPEAIATLADVWPA